MPKIIDKGKEKLKILNSAIKVFNEKGFKKTNMTDISSGAGMSRTNIYQYFIDKEDIFDEVNKNLEKFKDVDEVMNFILNFESHDYIEKRKELEEQINEAKKELCENFYRILFCEDDNYPSEDNIAHTV